jgi:hypothetical protein
MVGWLRTARQPLPSEEPSQRLIDYEALKAARLPPRIWKVTVVFQIWGRAMSRSTDKHGAPMVASPVKGAWRQLHSPTFGRDARVREECYDPATSKTYNYLRLAMLVAVAALAYSIVEEYRHARVHCFLGSISGYYYAPVRPVFIGVMLTIGVALIVMKGRTPFVDGCLSLAGMMAPIVAFIPTSDDLQGVCRPAMLDAGHYEPAPTTPFIGHAINNNLHALVFAGSVAIALVLIAYVTQRLTQHPSTAEYKVGFWINVAGGLVFVTSGWILLHWGYGWVLDAHARAAVAMFAFLAAAAIANGCYGMAGSKSDKAYAVIYLVVGGAMILAGLWFLVVHARHRTGHLVLWIEATEIFLFVVFWAVQTVQRWNRTV